MSELFLGIDVGGSAVKLGALEADGTVRGEARVDVEPAPDLTSTLARVADAARTLAPSASRAAGVGLPGLVDRDAGSVSASPNLPWLEGRPLREELATRLGLPTRCLVFENDANAAALGEARYGAAREARNALVLTLGTGIGGGLILGGELFTGEGAGGEFGHVVVDPEGPPCGCGNRGCLEQFASATAARRRALAEGLPRDAPGDLPLLVERAGEPGAERALLEAVGRDLGHGLGLVLTLLDVRTFVVGGGFGSALPRLMPGIQRGISEWSYGERVDEVRVLPAELGPRAGWIGAARLALEAAAPPPA